MDKKKIVVAGDAPSSVGPYSQAVIARGFIFVSGQGPVDISAGRLVLGDIRSECELTIRNIEAVLRAAGASLDDVVRCTVFLRDLTDFRDMNEVYRRFFPAKCPARTTVGAGDLLDGIKVEIDAIAMLPTDK